MTAIEDTQQQSQELERLYKQFDDNFKEFAILDDNEIIDKFTKLAEKIVKYNKADCIKFLLQYFHDKDEDYNGLDWLQESLSGIIEGFKDEIYVKGILMNLHLMLPHAKDWAMRLFNMIFSTENCKQLFIENINLVKPTDLIEVFNTIDQTYEYEEYDYDPRIKELRNKIIESN